MWGSGFFGKVTGLFHEGDGTKVVQTINLFAVAGAMYAMYQDPDSIGESILDGVVHGYTFYALRQDADTLEALGACALNFMRIGAIYQGVTTGCTSFPLAVLATDTLFHSYNVLHSLWVGTDKPEEHQNTNEVTSAKLN